MNKELINFIKNKYNSDNYICLHEPVFRGNEKKYLEECIDSTYVSSVGPFVDEFEKLISEITKTNKTTRVSRFSKNVSQTQIKNYTKFSK